MLLPGIAVFLDVDDLDDIGDLEGYIKATGVMLCFLSRRYFVSTNCLREVRATFDQGKPIVLVHEEQEGKGGGPLEALQAECPEDMRGKIFERRKPITFHRISHFRNLTLKLIATEMLQCSPRYLDVVSGVSLVMPGEATASELSLPQPLVLWCSAGNPSAAGVAQELAAALGVGRVMVRSACKARDRIPWSSRGEVRRRSCCWCSTGTRGSSRELCSSVTCVPPHPT